MLCVNKFVMEIKEETHLILPSDQTHNPNNTASKFKVKLPHTIRLTSGVDWYASCDNVIILREVNSQALVPMIKVTVDNFLDPDNAHLNKDTGVLRHISRDNVKEMKKGQKRGCDDSDKNPMVEIMLFNQHAKRKTFYEFEFTLLDDNDKLTEFGKGKTQINTTLRPIPVSSFPHEFTLIVPFNETLQLKSKFDFDGSREVGVMQVALPTTFINVKYAEMNFTVLDVSKLANTNAWHYRIPQGMYSNKLLIQTINSLTSKISMHIDDNNKTLIRKKVAFTYPIMQITINKPLALVLGFRQEISNQGLPVTSPDKIEAYARFNTLFMYAPGLVKETMVGDGMASFMGNVTPVFEREIYIVEPPIVIYVPVMEDLPCKDSIRLDLHDELGRPLAWDKDTIQKPQATKLLVPNNLSIANSKLEDLAENSSQKNGTPAHYIVASQALKDDLIAFMSVKFDLMQKEINSL